MAFSVTKNGETEYYVDLGEPLGTRLNILSGKMLSEQAAVLARAITQGLIKLFKDFGLPESENPEGG